MSDPTGMYTLSWFNRLDFAGTLAECYWPDGSTWIGAESFGGKPRRWTVCRNVLTASDGYQVEAVYVSYYPTLRRVKDGREKQR